VNVIRSHKMAVVRALVARAHALGVAAHLCIVNDPSSGFSDDVVARAVLGLAIQLQHHVAPEYGKAPPTVEFLPPGKTPPPADLARVVATLAIVGKIPSDPNAQGWHQPIGSGGYGGIDGFISTEGLDLDGLTECAGHELIETLVDPGCDEELEQADGSSLGKEPADATQAGGPNPNALRVPIDVGDGGAPVMGPNWCLAGWGVVGHRGKKDWLGLLPQNEDAPIGPYGYVARTSPDGTTTDLFGVGWARVELPAHLAHPDKRIGHRMAQMRASGAHRAAAKRHRVSA